MIIFAESHRKGECVFIVLDRDIDRNTFLTRIGVKDGSYSWKLGCRFYDALFCEAVDVVDEHERYYKSEYASPIDYIASEYGLEMSDLKIIENYILENKRILYTDLYKSCEGHLAEYMLSEGMRKTLQDILNGGQE